MHTNIQKNYYKYVKGSQEGNEYLPKEKMAGAK